MTQPRLMPERLPGWPRWLIEELAAAYVGLGIEAFRQEVAADVWPKPRKAGRGSGRNVWDRNLLDQVSDEISNPSKSAKERMLRVVKGDAKSVDPVPA